MILTYITHFAYFTIQRTSKKIYYIALCISWCHSVGPATHPGFDTSIDCDNLVSHIEIGKNIEYKRFVCIFNIIVV
jgi:hypothetical protein